MAGSIDGPSDAIAKAHSPGFWMQYRHHVVVGVALALLLHFAFPTGSPLMQPVTQYAGDLLIRFAELAASHGIWPRHRDVSGRLAPIVLVEIDDATHLKWGEPAVTPRDRLAALLTIAIGAGAAVVVVDIDLSQKSASEQADRALEEVISTEVKSAKQQRRASRIVLSRRLVTEDDQNQRFRRLYFETIDEKVVGVQAGAATFIRDEDLVIRRWHLVQPACYKGKGDAAHSLQLLVTATLFNAQTELEQARLRLAAVACSPANDLPGDRHLNLQFREGYAVPLDDESVVSRMNFKFNWETHRHGDLGKLETLRGNRTLLTLPAMLVEQYAATDAASAMQDAVVVVGNTHYDSKDFHLTPVGEIPGVLLVANAIYSLLDSGVMPEPGKAVTVATEVLAIALLAGVFTVFSTKYALWVGCLAVLFALLPVAIALFRFGVWFDFLFPLVGPVAHQLTAVYFRRSH